MRLRLLMTLEWSIRDPASHVGGFVFTKRVNRFLEHVVYEIIYFNGT